MNQIQNTKVFDLKHRTSLFSRSVRDYVQKLPSSITNNEYGKQLTRSAGSVGANYIEANESLSKKDFVMRIKICRKEAKETRYWLELSQPQESNTLQRNVLMSESTEFIKIFSSIILKSEQ